MYVLWSDHSLLVCIKRLPRNRAVSFRRKRHIGDVLRGNHWAVFNLYKFDLDYE